MSCTAGTDSRVFAVLMPFDSGRRGYQVRRGSSASGRWQETESEGCVSAFGHWQETESEGCVSAWRWRTLSLRVACRRLDAGRRLSPKVACRRGAGRRLSPKVACRRRSDGRILSSRVVSASGRWQVCESKGCVSEWRGQAEKFQCVDVALSTRVKGFVKLL